MLAVQNQIHEPSTVSNHGNVFNSVWNCVRNFPTTWNCMCTVLFSEAVLCALTFRMTTKSLCLTKTSTQKWDLSWSEATTVLPAHSSLSSTLCPWTQSTSRSAERRCWMSWMVKTTWTGRFYWKNKWCQREFNSSCQRMSQCVQWM